MHYILIETSVAILLELDSASYTDTFVIIYYLD